MSLTGLIFLFGYVGGLGMSIARGPIWGLYTYIAVFYLHPPSRWWGAGLPSVRWALLAALVTLLCVWARRRAPEKPSFMSHGLAKIFLVFVLWIWVQSFWVISFEHIDGAILFTKYLLLMYLIYEIIETEEDVRNFLWAHVIGCFYLGWLATNLDAGGRLEGVGGPGIDDANSMSMHIGTGIMVGAVLLLSEKKWYFLIMLSMLPFLLNGMVLGNSRGAFLGLFLAGLALLLLKPLEVRKQFYVFGLLGTMLFLMLAHELFWERISSLKAVGNDQEELDSSAASRIVLIKAQGKMFLDYPFGVGHKGTATLSANYLEAKYLTIQRNVDGAVAARSSHNTVMSVVVDHGIPGIVLLVLFLARCRIAIRNTCHSLNTSMQLRCYSSAVGAALILAIVAGQFSPYLKAEVQYWLVGLLMALELIAKAPPREPDSDESTATRRHIGKRSLPGRDVRYES